MRNSVCKLGQNSRGAWVLVVMGWRSAWYLAPTLSLLYLAIPLWDFLLLPLREATIGFVGAILDLLAIPALIDGFNISLPAGMLVVAGGCASVGSSWGCVGYDSARDGWGGCGGGRAGAGRNVIRGPARLFRLRIDRPLGARCNRAQHWASWE